MKINKINYYFYLLLGFIIITYIAYIRFFLVRLPKDLHFNPYDKNYIFKIVFLTLSIIICIIAITNNILSNFNLNNNKNKLLFLIETISQVINNSLKHVYSFLMSFLSNPYEINAKISSQFYAYAHKRPETFLLFICFFIRLVIVTIFILEVFLLFKLNYFYKSLSLLVIILVIKILLFLLRDTASNLIVISEILIITDKGIDKKTMLPITTYSLKPEYADNDLNYLVEQFIICNKLSGYLIMYDRYSHFLTPKFNILIYFLYLIGWLYVFFVNLI
jgi:hypothetical protein